MIKVLTWEDCAKVCSTWEECDAFGFREVAMDPYRGTRELWEPRAVLEPKECRLYKNGGLEVNVHGEWYNEWAVWGWLAGWCPKKKGKKTAKTMTRYFGYGPGVGLAARLSVRHQHEYKYPTTYLAATDAYYDVEPDQADFVCYTLCKLVEDCTSWKYQGNPASRRHCKLLFTTETTKETNGGK